MFGYHFSDFLQIIFAAICDGSIYAVAGLGIIIIYRTTDILNFAQGDFIMLGGVLMVTFVQLTGLPFIICFFLAVISSVVIALCFERLGNRIFVKRNASLSVQSFATIGVSMILETAVLVAWGHDPLALKPFTGDTPVFIFGAAITPQIIWLFVISAIIFVASKLFFDFTKFGKAMRACADNPLGASVVGLEKFRMAQYSFAISGALCAVIGIALTPIYFTGYAVGLPFTIKGFIAAVIGGMTNPFGAVIGGLLLGLLENFGAALIDSGYKDIIALVVLIVVLLMKKTGRPGLEAK